MTNNHIHLFALIPLNRLLSFIRQKDPELYQKIYVYCGPPVDDTPSGTLILLNEEVEGKPFEIQTNKDHWVPIATVYHQIKNDYVIDLNKIIRTANEDNEQGTNVFEQMETIQKCVRIFLRHYKVYYYLIYLSLTYNYQANVFYLNLRSKTGTIHTDSKYGQRKFIQSEHAMSREEFNEKLDVIAKDDRDLQPSDYKLIYQIYLGNKLDAELILKAVLNFNKDFKKPGFISTDELLAPLTEIEFLDIYTDRPQSMIQMTITFPKGHQDRELNVYEQTLQIKRYLYAAVLINEEFGFKFFNGFDLVGDETCCHPTSSFMPLIAKLLYFRKFGLNPILHLDEVPVFTQTIYPFERYLITKRINRIGHGVSFVPKRGLVQLLKNNNLVIFVESCPISNFVLYQLKPSKHPHQLAIFNPKIRKNIKIMLCSDDNGIFGYTTVQKDYEFAAKHWKLTQDNLIEIARNGLMAIPKEYKKFYHDLFQELLKELA